MRRLLVSTFLGLLGRTPKATQHKEQVSAEAVKAAHVEPTAPTPEKFIEPVEQEKPQVVYELPMIPVIKRKSKLRHTKKGAGRGKKR